MLATDLMRVCVCSNSNVRMFRSSKSCEKWLQTLVTMGAEESVTICAHFLPSE